MKVITMFLLITLVYSCSSPKFELGGNWIIVRTEQGKNSNWVPHLGGTLMNFDENILKVNSVYSDTVIEHAYRIDQNHLITDSFNFRIAELGPDRLIFEADSGAFFMHLLPLKHSKKTTSEYDALSKVLVSSNWELGLPEYSFRFYFDTTQVGANTNDESTRRNYVLEETTSNNEHLSVFEWWILRKFEDCVLLSYSVGQREIDNIQILEPTTNGYECMLFSKNESNDVLSIFSHVEPISSVEFTRRKNIIIGKWFTNAVIEPDLVENNNLEQISTSIAMGKSHYESRFKLDDMLNKEVFYEFRDDRSYAISSKKEIIRKGSYWELTNDGKYIVLDSRRVGGNFIRILNLSDEGMMIKKKEEISMNENDDINYNELLFSLEMKKAE